MTWATILVIAAGAYAFKFAGMFGLGRLAESRQARALGALLPPAMLAALVTQQTIGGESGFEFDARLVGVAAGGLAAWRGLPFWVVVVVAAAVTGTVRML